MDVRSRKISRCTCIRTAKASAGIEENDVAIVYRHVIVNGKASLNKTDLTIVSEAEFQRLQASDTKTRSMLYLSTAVL